MKKRQSIHDNWATPKWLYDELNKEFEFDFDPCPLSENGVILPEKDGLLIEWGERNFVNPPYSQKGKEPFVYRALEFKRRGRLSVLLLPVSTSTVLFHEIIIPNANEIRFVRGRVKFEGVNSQGKLVNNKTGMHDSMIVIFDGREDGIKTYHNRIKNYYSTTNLVDELPIFTSIESTNPPN